MPGVRLRHLDYANCTVTVPIPHRPYPVPFLCPTCNKTHEVKTYHLTVDDQGSVIVSTTVFQRLREVGLAGFTVENEVRSPPSIRLIVPHLDMQAHVMEIGNG